MLTIFKLLILFPSLLLAQSQEAHLYNCELAQEGYKTYHCRNLNSESWVVDTDADSAPLECLEKCRQWYSDCTHVTYHVDNNQAYCQLQDCSGIHWNAPDEDYLYHEFSCYDTYQCRDVQHEPEVISFPENVTAGCHGADPSDESSCMNFDQEACFMAKYKCYWKQDTCTNANLAAQAISDCQDPPAGSIAVFFINFFIAGVIMAILVFNCPDFVEAVKADVTSAAKKILSTLFSVWSASFGLYEGINVSVVLGCLGDFLELGSSCENTLDQLESGTIITILFSALSMLLIFTFACGMMWFGLKADDDSLKLGLYFVHFFELGVLIGCAVGLSANPDNCSSEYHSIIKDQKTAFTKVVVFTILYMVMDLLAFFGIDYAYVSALCGCASEEKEDEEEKENDGGIMPFVTFCFSKKEEDEETKMEEEMASPMEKDVVLDVEYVEDNAEPYQLKPSGAEPVEQVM